MREFPIARRIGMSYDEYWNDDPERFSRYLHAYNINMEAEMKRDSQTMDVESWLIGKYVTEALNATVGNMFRKGTQAKYPERPHTMAQEMVREQSDDDLMMQNYRDMMAWSQAMNQNMK